MPPKIVAAGISRYRRAKRSRNIAGAVRTRAGISVSFGVSRMSFIGMNELCRNSAGEKAMPQGLKRSRCVSCSTEGALTLIV